ncbi:hypothetical protein Rleg4DRAFT_7510 [Rhizobium leguminosarum bv. trifolii WSM2297]|uniref:Uncharacterized protein n=1 Tax=Rhizobium leguminosarum bv. trifolii WSM2297 TaxID=754762 RepID=J0WJE7_RHILT|nr:hypothetical protein Rleg4DRAFT_7510 [Rhizobium leguminosarum bv. trifolii WSM2297]
MLRPLANGCRELAAQPMPAVGFHNVPQLNEDFEPGFRIGAAVKGRELSRLHLGYMIAGFYLPAVVGEDQR